MEGAKIHPGKMPIDGVQVIPLQQISDDRGAVYHMLKATDSHFLGFGEIYFSTIFPGIVKGWKAHRRVTANYACVAGEIKLVLHDNRPASPTAGVTMEIDLGPASYFLAVIPPRIWHGFQGTASPVSIVANCATEPNDPSELDRLDSATSQIPYTW